MCRSILALDPHYTDVRPRHPSGGPDGGRDIEALFDGNVTAFGAVGFHNGANDSSEQKREIRSKFSRDLNAALRAKPDLKVFAFLTNLHLTMGEQSEMIDEARRAGVEHCDVLDRERLRIELDSPAGFFIRFQHLGIPLSEAEQASFLAHYGDRVQEVVSTGFQRMERTLNRILFLQESRDVLSGIFVRFRLKNAYPATEIGHFRAFVSVHLHAIKHDIHGICFGASDKSNRFRRDHPAEIVDQPPGIKHGMSHGQWEKYVKLTVPEMVTEAEVDDATEDASDHNKLVQVGDGSSVGMDPVSLVVIRYHHDDHIIRYQPRLELRDLDSSWFMPVLNQAFAKKIHTIEVFANGYLLAHIGSENFRIDASAYQSEQLDTFFTPEELDDPWVRVRPADFASAFILEFSSTTPRRMFGHEEPPDIPKSK